jgi:hypothetical protein
MSDDSSGFLYSVRFRDTLDASPDPREPVAAHFRSFDEALFAARLVDVERFRVARLDGPGLDARLFLRGRADPTLMRAERVEIPAVPSLRAASGTRRNPR